MPKFFKRIFYLTVFVSILAGFTFFSYVIQQSNDPCIYLEKVLLNSEQKILKSFFAPDDDIKSVLINLIKAEKEQILVAIYWKKQKDIADALIDAYERGVSIEIVADRSFGTDRFSKIPYLANNKIPIWVFQTDLKTNALMHNKFVVFKSILGKSIVWTGSYNFTNRANESNQENVIVLDDKDIVESFCNQFAKIKKRSVLISGKPGEDYIRRTVKEDSIIKTVAKWLRNILKVYDEI
jgi:phosphatidylserine/phosphatidylglycerophosphate/cardiolipin synthase-like enzyme